LKGISVRFARLLSESPGHAETLTTVACLVAIGEPSIRFEAVFALDDIVAARERLDEGHLRGRIVIHVRDRRPARS
jgi:hypothetical protein